MLINNNKNSNKEIKKLRKQELKSERKNQYEKELKIINNEYILKKEIKKLKKQEQNLEIKKVSEEIIIPQKLFFSNEIQKTYKTWLYKLSLKKNNIKFFWYFNLKKKNSLNFNDWENVDFNIIFKDKILHKKNIYSENVILNSNMSIEEYFWATYLRIMFIFIKLNKNNLLKETLKLKLVLLYTQMELILPPNDINKILFFKFKFLFFYLLKKIYGQIENFAFTFSKETDLMEKNEKKIFSLLMNNLNYDKMQDFLFWTFKFHYNHFLKTYKETVIDE